MSLEKCNLIVLYYCSTTTRFFQFFFHHPYREHQLKYHGLNQFGQVMMIRLFVDEKEDTEHYGEYIDLCILKYSPSNGVLEVSPDFTNNRKPYTIELENRKETLEVWIEHVSTG